MGYFAGGKIFLLVTSLALLGPAAIGPAQTPAPAPATGAPTILGDGLSLLLPAGWKTVLLDTSAAPANLPAEARETDTLSVLLSARPGDEKRTSRLSIVRDARAAARLGPPARLDAKARLNEIAAEQGFRAERFSDKGRTFDLDSIFLCEVDGVAGDGRKRNFVAVTVLRSPAPELRCYWEYDPADAAAQPEFDAWLASMTYQTNKVADIMTGAVQSTEGRNSAPAAPVAASSPTPAVLSPEAGELVSKYRGSLIVVAGDKGLGSGFVSLLDGEPWLLTNAHVLADNPHPHFTPLGGAPLLPGPAFLAVEHDICKIKMPAGTNALEIMNGVDSGAKIGDTILVLGNAEGGGVIHPFEGKIVGIGPNLVEVDAAFVSGNSGSPIIHVASGKAIGIATYLVTKKVDPSGNGKDVQTTVRRFGYRLDSVKKWEAVNWPRFYAQSAQAAQIEETGEEFQTLFADAKADHLLASTYRNPGIRHALENFSSRVNTTRQRMSAADAAFARRELLSNLRSATLNDVNAFDSRNAYDYFRRVVADEARFREEIYSGFTKALNERN